MGKESRTFTPEDVNRIVEERLARDRQERREQAKADARVIAEPRVYALDSPHSYYLDALQHRQDPHGIMYPDAHGRLNRYAAELAHEMEQGSAEGKRAEKVLREATRESEGRIHEQRYRQAVKEIRTLTTGGGTTATATASAAAFVAPAFLEAQYALFRDTYRTFTDQCLLLPLPAYGMQLYLPYFSTAAAEAQQTENSGVTEVAPATAFQNSPVATIAGQVTITQQLYERFWQGGAADVIFARQLAQHLGTQVDKFVLNTVITNGVNLSAAAAVANSLAPFFADLAAGREALTDTAGVRLRPTHCFTTYDLYSFLSKSVDSTGRPLFIPQVAPGVPLPGFPVPQGADDGLNASGGMPAWSRFTGTILPGGVLWFTDDNIPATGGNSQMIISSPAMAVVVAESPAPVLRTFQQTFAGNLAPVVQLYEYVACITRHASGTSVTTGAAYATTNK
jgi:hypothetical protein